jgi:hypothetical protein
VGVAHAWCVSLFAADSFESIGLLKSGGWPRIAAVIHCDEQILPPGIFKVNAAGDIFTIYEKKPVLDGLALG